MDVKRFSIPGFSERMLKSFRHMGTEAESRMREIEKKHGHAGMLIVEQLLAEWGKLLDETYALGMRDSLENELSPTQEQ